MSRVCAECAFGVVRAQEGVFKGVSTRGGGGGHLAVAADGFLGILGLSKHHLFDDRRIGG